MKTKRILSMLFIILYIFSQALTILAFDSSASISSLQINAPAAILIDQKNGQILFERDAYSKYYPASITKIMTALIVIEHTDDFEAMITASRNAVYGIEAGSSVMGLSEGESFSVDAILHGLMLRSGNDAAVALAEYVAGSEKEFAELMTARAKELGCKNTSFKNAHGLPDDEHYTTAYDMALILREAVKSEKFVEVSSCREYTLPPTPFYKNQERILYNQNKLITNNEYYNPDVICSKTGFTDLAKNTLVSYGKRGDTGLIAVVLFGERGDSYTDTTALLSYGFDNFSYRRVLDKEEYSTSYVMSVGYNGEEEIVGETPLVPESSLTLLVRNDIFENDIKLEPDYSGFTKDNIAPGDQVGILRVIIYGKEQAAVPLIAECELSSALFYERKLLENTQSSAQEDESIAPAFSQNETDAGIESRPSGFNIFITIAMGIALFGLALIAAAMLFDRCKRNEVVARQKMRRLRREMNNGKRA